MDWDKPMPSDEPDASASASARQAIHRGLDNVLAADGAAPVLRPHESLSARINLVDGPVLRPQPDPVCETCRFSAFNGSPMLDCRRHAPIVPARITGGFTGSAWPHVSEHHWCGDHEPKEPKRV